ncbi:C40 family peptidase [Tindallia californiensis]|uniref:Cell wall-associated hydrolase, NlpC family n=1 Tax=Tindallia californiensis TaxID=159292 RepID=A0A1H3NAS1_9FIRM|nr:C40 family peptidase [Tindallia californiensis]SDY85854.1 Cell wall-associated hydrolase, NlpC family [Tindallia californiensis]
MSRYKKKCILSLITLSLITSCLPAYAQAGSGTVVGDNSTVRSEANLNASVVQTIPIGTKVTINGSDNDFLQVEVSGKNLSGWIHQDLVSLKDSAKKQDVYKGVVTASTLNIRSGPSTDSNLQGQLRIGNELQVIGESGDWLQIVDERSNKGWVHGDYINKIPNLPSAYANTEQISIYTERKDSSGILKHLQKHDIVYIKDYKDGWYLVITESEVEGWIKRNSVTLIINGNAPASRGGSRGNITGIVSTTEKYLGTPYRYAATGPNQFDCSGFVYYILHEYYGDMLRQNNINLPRSSRYMATVGTAVGRNQLEVGDLVFFNNGSSSSINHVGIYIGGNNFIHASSGSNMSVIVSSLNADNYRRRYSTARRLF